MFSTAAAVWSFSYLPSGFILDKLGPKITGCLGALIMTGGSIMIYLAKAPEYSLLIPGFVVLCSGGPPIAISSYSFSQLFPEQSGYIMALFIVMLNLSTLVFPIYDLVHFYGHVDLSFLMKIHIGVGIFIFTVSLLFWPMKTCDILAASHCFHSPIFLYSSFLFKNHFYCRYLFSSPSS